MNNVGRIHSFESFGTVDGPGIRFVIFMQGCHFRCLYCHNPDTWELEGGKGYSVEEVMAKIKRFIPYFRSSGGGITVSGGEPLLQIDFLSELFKKCKEQDIHTTIDTNGNVSVSVEKEKLDTLLEYTDLVLLDIKHIDPVFHRRLTSLSNENVINFARYLDNKRIPVWLRYVVVPGLTDNPVELKKLSKFLSGLSNLEKVELLPFHKMGEYKWKELGLPYELEEIPACSEADIENVRKILKK